MADVLNPFEENSEPSDVDEPENGAANIDNRPAERIHSKHETTELTWDNIAAKLLRDNYILTALELYTEFIESGRELPRLRDYFSNPGNFERTKEDTPSPPTLREFLLFFSFDGVLWLHYDDYDIQT